MRTPSQWADELENRLTEILVARGEKRPEPSYGQESEGGVVAHLIEEAVQESLKEIRSLVEADPWQPRGTLAKLCGAKLLGS